MTYEIGSRYPKSGDKVRVAEKKNYDSGQLTEGVVRDVLTSKKFHPRGHKVRLINGIIGRVQVFADQEKTNLKTNDPPTVSYTPNENDLV